ncbi:hypothetical protein ACIQ9E_06820 [Streptomyces sp. NPDC094448]|uniref:hypothetical protein n=1 Tax=Streptomyces sp. NPDC094448 TaxID=3366063 RepID=UPI003821CF75
MARVDAAQAVREPRDEFGGGRHSPHQEIVTWRPVRIPVCSFGADDRTSGLCVDMETGQLWFWSRYADRRCEFGSLTEYLQETADALEVPSLVTGAMAGLVNGALAWGPPTWADPEAPWDAFTA